MPVTYIITDVITATDLRNRIGAPVANDTSDVGFITDAMLEEVIQKHHDALIAQVDNMIGELDRRGQQPGPADVFDETDLTGAVSITGVREIDLVEATFYPWAMWVVEETTGRQFEHDPKILRTLRTAPNVRYRYYIQGDDMFWIPSSVETVRAYLPNLTRLRLHHASGEMIAQTNERIVQEAYRMLQRRIKEGSRQEGVEFFDTDRVLRKRDESII